jgi:hypothetical protein
MVVGVWRLSERSSRQKLISWTFPPHHEKLKSATLANQTRAIVVIMIGSTTTEAIISGIGKWNKRRKNLLLLLLLTK